MLYNNRVTICACASRSFIDKEKVVKVAAFLRKEGYDVVVEPDLCEKVRREHRICRMSPHPRLSLAIRGRSVPFRFRGNGNFSCIGYPE